MKLLFIIFISVFYCCTSKAMIQKYGSVTINKEVKSSVISINARNFEMGEIINIVVKVVYGTVDNYIYTKFMSETEMHRSPMESYAFESYKKTPIKTESSDTVTKYYYEIKKNEDEELLVVNFLNYKKNDASSYLMIKSDSNTSTLYIVFIVCLCISVPILCF